MSSKGQNNNGTKMSNSNANRTKMFHVEFTQKKKVSNYKPRFYTNKNLFFVRNIKKNNAKLYKKKFKLKFIKDRQNALARRELRNKHGLFITHHNKPPINSDKETPTNKLIKLKKKINFKFNIINQNSNQISNKDIILENNSIIINKLLTNENTSNINIFSDDNMNNLFNNNTPIKKQKNSNNKNSKYSSGRWNVEEHKKFLEAIIKYGNDWKEVQKHIGTRSSSQARSHAQKFFIKLKQDQSKSKISNMIDYSNSSIKSFHDALHSLEPEKKQKIIQELESVVFDKHISNKKRKRNRTKGNNLYSETNIEMDFISQTDYFREEDINQGQIENKKMNTDSLDEEKIIDKRKFINEIENSKNGMFTDEEYEKSFHKIFVDKENDKIQIESRKQSIEDDFMFNINI